MNISTSNHYSVHHNQGLSWIDFVDFDIICDRHFDC